MIQISTGQIERGDFFSVLVMVNILAHMKTKSFIIRVNQSTLTRIKDFFRKRIVILGKKVCKGNAAFFHTEEIEKDSCRFSRTQRRLLIY